MREHAITNLYAGLSDLSLGDAPIDLGRGLILTKTYAHLMAPFTLAFAPAAPGKHHPGPWKSAASGIAYDITAQLQIPEAFAPEFSDRLDAARAVLFVLRLWSDPAIVLRVVSSHPFADLATAEDGKAHIIPFETLPRHFTLGLVDESKVIESLDWVRENWFTAYELYKTSAEFRLAADALTSGQFIPNTALTMVSLWGALEAIFSPSTSELRFRVSALIAAYLDPPGQSRIKRQDQVAHLYDKRSAAAHGKPKHAPDDLLNTFELLRKVLIKIIRNKRVPSRIELDGCLFGSAPWC